MSTIDIAKKYVALCKEGRFEACLDQLYSKDAMSVEAFAPPGQNAVSTGLDAIRAKGKWWFDNHTIHKAEAFGPYPNGDRFAVQLPPQRGGRGQPCQERQPRR